MPRRLLVPLSLSLSLLGSSALAQTASGDAVRGKSLFENTRTATGNNSLANCTSCHTDGVQGRRIAISANTGGTADPYADITFESAMTRFDQAMRNRAEMRAYFGVLTAQQVWDIAAYLADTPKTNPVSETQLNFTAANSGFSAAQTVTLTHARATSENLAITDVAVFGTGASQFVVGNAAQCEGVTLQPGNNCQINVTYSPTTNAAATAELVLTMRQGPSTSPTFERVLPLSGTISSASGGGSSNDDGGGGALGLGWLAALGAAVAGLSRRRRA